MRNTLETRLGMFAALALIAAFFILETVGGFDVFKRGYRISALFNSVQELTAGAPVKMAGVPIGRVEDIGFAVLPQEGTIVRVGKRQFRRIVRSKG